MSLIPFRLSTRHDPDFLYFAASPVLAVIFPLLQYLNNPMTFMNPTIRTVVPSVFSCVPDQTVFAFITFSGFRWYTVLYCSVVSWQYSFSLCWY